MQPAWTDTPFAQTLKLIQVINDAPMSSSCIIFTRGNNIGSSGGLAISTALTNLAVLEVAYIE
jgi:hypothetical protein